MAAVHKQYEADFAIGAKLLASFKGTMRAAQARLKQLETASKQVQTAVGGISSAFTNLIGIAGAFSVAAVMKKALDLAIKEEERLKSIQVLLLKNNQIRAMGGGDMKKALAYAKGQAELIENNNIALAKEGVLRKDVYDALAKQLALGGVPTKQIMHSVGAMGDLLVAIKGVSASEEDAAEFAQAMNKAIFGGKGRGLQAYGIFLPEGWKDQFTDYQSRLDDLMRRIDFARGESIRRAADSIGQIAVAQKNIDTLYHQLGHLLLPVVGDLAQDMSDFIAEMSKTENMPVIWDALVQTIRDFKVELFGADTATKQLKESLGTAFGKWLADELKSDLQTLQDIKAVLVWLRDWGTKSNQRFRDLHHMPKKGPLSNFWDPSVDIWGHKVDPNLAPHWPWDAKRATPTPPPYSGAPAPSAGLPTGHVTWGSNVAPTAAAAAATGTLANVAASAKLEPYKKIFEEAGAQYGIDPRLLMAIAQQENVAGRDLNPLGISPGGGGPTHFADMEAARAGIFRQVELMSRGIYQGKGPYAKARTLAELAQIYSPIGASNDVYGTNASELSGWQAALARMGADPNMMLRSGGDTHHYNFTPSIIIHGDATDEAQRSMSTRLRDHMNDFVDQFKAAQYQARRLSYEGGYS